MQLKFYGSMVNNPEYVIVIYLIYHAAFSGAHTHTHTHTETKKEHITIYNKGSTM